MSLPQIEAKLREDGQYDFESTDDLKNMLDGLTQMRKIKKVGNEYAGLDVDEGQAEEKTAKKKNPNISSYDDVKYPEYVTTEKDKVQYLLSPEAPKLTRPRTIMYWEENKVETGRQIHDALTTTVTTHEVCIAADNAKGCNIAVYHRRSEMARGFGVSVRDGKYRVYISAPDNKNEKLFDSYEEMRAWIVKNL